jgi:hypothetical protein
MIPFVIALFGGCTMCYFAFRGSSGVKPVRRYSYIALCALLVTTWGTAAYIHQGPWAIVLLAAGGIILCFLAILAHVLNIDL